ncbi:hypothetical protein [Roseiflexus sp.]|uniref:hypothetical protein n=1 Tax=Roseiflexus sp. TaxID=2562120 RepID=UPI00398BA3A2
MPHAVRITRLAIVSCASGLLALLCMAGIVVVLSLAPTSDELVVALVDGILIPVRNLSVLVALVTGVFALMRIRRKEGAEKGATLAWLGIALGIVWIVFGILVMLAFVLLLLASREPEGSNGLTLFPSLAIILVSVLRMPSKGFSVWTTRHRRCHIVRLGAPASR